MFKFTHLFASFVMHHLFFISDFISGVTFLFLGGSLFLTEVFIRILLRKNQNPSDFICFKMMVLLLSLKNISTGYKILDPRLPKWCSFNTLKTSSSCPLISIASIENRGDMSHRFSEGKASFLSVGVKLFPLTLALCVFMVLCFQRVSFVHSAWNLPSFLSLWLATCVRSGLHSPPSLHVPLRLPVSSGTFTGHLVGLSLDIWLAVSVLSHVLVLLSFSSAENILFFVFWIMSSDPSFNSLIVSSTVSSLQVKLSKEF